MMFEFSILLTIILDLVIFGFVDNYFELEPADSAMLYLILFIVIYFIIRTVENGIGFY